MRILEATIAVLLVSGVFITVYSNQPSRDISAADYFYDLHTQIFADISINRDFRLNVLNVVDDEDASDSNFRALDEFVASQIPDFVDYSLQICVMGSDEDHCKMLDEADIRDSMDRDVFVEDIIIASELGIGEDAKYQPKRVRLYMWEE